MTSSMFMIHLNHFRTFLNSYKTFFEHSSVPNNSSRTTKGDNTWDEKKKKKYNGKNDKQSLEYSFEFRSGTKILSDSLYQLIMLGRHASIYLDLYIFYLLFV